MIYSFLPIGALIYSLYYYRNNSLNSYFVLLIFVSYFFFATNYHNFGLDLPFDIFRTLHRFIGIICSLLAVIHIFKFRVNVFRHEVFKLLALFFLVLIISSIGNDLNIDSFIHYVRNFVFISLLVLFLYFKIESKDHLDELFTFILHLTLFLAVLVVFDHLITGSKRVLLFYSNPNYLAFSLLPGLSMALFSKHSLKLFFAFLIFFAIYMTDSKAGFLSSLCIFSFYLLSFSRNSLSRVVLIFTLLSLCTVFFSHVMNKSFFNGGTSNTRIGMVYLTANVINSSPLNGIGYGQFRKSFHLFIDQHFIDRGHNEINSKYFSNQKLTEEELQLSIKNGYPKNSEIMTHSDLLTVICELGLVGIIFLIYLFYKLYLELKKLFLFSDHSFLLSISLVSSVLCFSLFHNNMTAFVFWFVLFVPFIMNRNYKANDSS